MSTIPAENRIIPGTTQTSTGNAQTPVQTQTVDEPLFSGANSATTTDVSTNATPEETGGDKFVSTTSANTGASSEALMAQKQEVDVNNTQLKEDAGTAKDTIKDCDETIQVQQAQIDALNQANETLEAQNIKLNQEIGMAKSQLYMINNRINELNTQIEQNSGFVGTAANFLKGIIGKGVDVNALKSEVADLQAQREEIQKQIEAKEKAILENGGKIDENNLAIETAASDKTNAEEVKALQEADLKEIQEAYKKGLISSEDLEAAIAAAVEAEEKEAAEAAEKEAGEATEKGESNTATNTGKPSEAQINGAAKVFEDIMANGELTTDSLEGIQNGIDAQDPVTGEFDGSQFETAYIEAGFTPEEFETRIEFVEAIASYQDMGMQIDAETFANMSILGLDTIVESAMVQDVMKSTSSKIIGNAANFSSKKDMETYSNSVDDFISSYSALNSYYQKNDVDDLEAKAFLSLCSDKLSKINQGYVYETSEIQKGTNEAASLMTTLKTKTSSDEAIGTSASIQFEDTKHKTDDAIRNAEAQLGENDDTSVTEEYRAEFLDLTNKFNNSDTDSTKQISIKAMEALYQKALKAKENPDVQNTYKEIKFVA